MKKLNKLLLIAACCSLVSLPLVVDTFSEQQDVVQSSAEYTNHTSYYYTVSFDQRLLRNFLDYYDEDNSIFQFDLRNGIISRTYTVPLGYYFKLVNVKSFHYVDDDDENPYVMLNNTITSWDEVPTSNSIMKWRLFVSSGSAKFYDFQYFVDDELYNYFDFTNEEDFDCYGVQLTFLTDLNLSNGQFATSLYETYYPLIDNKLLNAYNQLENDYDNLYRENNLLQLDYGTALHELETANNRIETLSAGGSVFDLLGSAFESVSSVFSIQIAPFITLGMLLSVPILVFVIVAVVKMIGGGD